jgi:hypothetical protein
MSLQIWMSSAYSTVYRCGGWAYVRQGSQGDLSGAAGGDRHTTGERTALLGLAAALRDLPGAASAGTIRIATTSLELMAFAAVVAGLGGETPSAGPAENLDLWAQIAAAARGRRLGLARAPLDAFSPTAFTTAWAELARDKAKTSGVFLSPIPKANLSKVKGLPVMEA